MEINELRQELIEKEVFLNQRVHSKHINIVDMSHIQIGSNIIEIDKRLFTSLLTAIGIKKTLLQSLFENYKNQNEILRILISQFKAKQKDTNIVFVYNNASRKLVNIIAENKIVSSYETYVNLVERQVEKGSQLRDLFLDRNTGKIKATFFNNGDFDILGLKDEYYKSGYSFDYDITQLQANYFMQRLVCLNGAVRSDNIATLNAHKPDEVGAFLQEVSNNAWVGANITSVKSTIQNKMETKASLNEVLSVQNDLRKIMPDNAYQEISGTLAGTRMSKVFPHHVLLNSEDHKHLITNVTKYDLFNEVTAVSSHFEKSGLGALGDTANRKIQLYGGRVLFSDNDLPNSRVKQIFSLN